MSALKKSFLTLFKPLQYVSIAETVCFSLALLCLLLDPHAMALAQSSFMPVLQESENIQLQAVLESEKTLFLFGLFMGVMATASLYLFFIWVVIHDRGQVFLMLLLLCLGLNMASTNDTMMQLLHINNPYMNMMIQTYTMVLAYFFSLFFTYYFLDIDTSAPLMKYPLFGTAFLLLVLLVIAAFNMQLVHFILPTLGVIAIAVVLLCGLAALSSGTSGVFSHIIAFSAFLVGSQATALYDLGMIQQLEDAKNISYMGFAVAAMLFAIVIAGQFAARQEEKEKELALSNERFMLAASGSNEGLFDWHRLNNDFYVSNQLRRIFGIRRETTPKTFRSWLKIVQSSDRPLVLRALRRLRHAADSSTVSFEYRIIRGKTERSWIHTKMVALKDHNTGQIVRLVGSVGDITQRKRSEAELRASETRFRSITEAHPVPVLIARISDGQILYASPGAETLLGTPSSMLISNRLERFVPRNEERRRLLDTLADGQEINMMEVTITRGDGSLLPAALSARHIHYHHENAFVVGLYDLTEKKEAEAQILRQQEALQQSEKMAALGGLLAGVAHELNNPLSVVMGQTSLLMETQDEPKTVSRAEKIFKAADRCSRIVKSFLALARRKPPEHKAVDVNELINGSLELLGYQFRNENVTLHLELEDNLPLVIGDDAQLTQAFTNMALNAAQAMHDWKGERSLSIKTETVNDHTIMIAFIDTGPGVSAELHKKIFEPFFTTKGGVGGTGVGLALCMNVITSHGGQLHLEDTPGGGASFVIHLPIAKNATLSPADDQEGESAAVPSPVSRKLRLLIVDDEVELAQTLADLLEPEGYETDLAANGQVALDKLKAGSFDLIISDLRMPVMDGPTMYAILAKDMPSYTKKIIYVTGDTLSTHINQFLRDTPVPVIEKPYRLADVRKAMAALLKEQESQGNMG
ncbi:MAG: PAS domain S-box protein [Alphaproteobacteria bacterium]|nr:PAS domain S-box protein [Alphaproteobacteria bacterium]